MERIMVEALNHPVSAIMLTLVTTKIVKNVINSITGNSKEPFVKVVILKKKD